jgi:hypothetical protein
MKKVGSKPDKNSSLRRLEFMPKNLNSNVNKNVCLLYVVLFQSFPCLSDPVRNFEKQFPIRRKLFPEPELLNHMACHDYTPNIGRSAAILVPGPRTSTPRYSSQPHTMICREILWMRE